MTAFRTPLHFNDIEAMMPAEARKVLLDKLIACDPDEVAVVECVENACFLLAEGGPSDAGEGICFNAYHHAVETVRQPEESSILEATYCTLQLVFRSLGYANVQWPLGYHALATEGLWEGEERERRVALARDTSRVLRELMTDAAAARAS